VLVERVVGLGVMLLAGALGAITLAESNALARTYLVVTGAAALAGIVIVAVLYAGGLASVIRKLEGMKRLAPLGANLQRLAKPRREWGWLLISSFVFQVQAAAVVYFAFLAVGVELTVAAALLVTAAAGIASVLPISISGIGVIEGAIAGTAVALGIAYEPAILGAIAIRLIVLPVSAACGAVYLFDDGARLRAAA
jgi:glycosyltransferase 2 family protein